MSFLNRYTIEHEDDDEETDDGDVQSIHTNMAVPWDVQTLETGMSVPWSTNKNSVADVPAPAAAASYPTEVGSRKRDVGDGAEATTFESNMKQQEPPSNYSGSSVGESTVGEKSAAALVDRANHGEGVDRAAAGAGSIEYHNQESDESTEDDGPSYTMPLSYSGMDSGGSDNWSMSDVSMGTHNFSVAYVAPPEPALTDVLQQQPYPYHVPDELSSSSKKKKKGRGPASLFARSTPKRDNTSKKNKNTSNLSSSGSTKDTLAAPDIWGPASAAKVVVNEQSNSSSISVKKNKPPLTKKNSLSSMKFWANNNLPKEGIHGNSVRTFKSKNTTPKQWEDIASVTDGDYEPPKVAPPIASLAPPPKPMLDDVVSVNESKAARGEATNPFSVQRLVHRIENPFGLNKNKEKKVTAVQEQSPLSGKELFDATEEESRSVGEDDDDIVSYMNKPDPTPIVLLTSSSKPQELAHNKNVDVGHSHAVKRGLNMAYGAAPSVLGDEDDDDSHGDNSTIFTAQVPLYVVQSASQRGDGADGVRMPPPPPVASAAKSASDPSTENNSSREKTDKDELPPRPVWFRFILIVLLLMVVGAIAGAAVAISKGDSSSSNTQAVRGSNVGVVEPTPPPSPNNATTPTPSFATNPTTGDVVSSSPTVTRTSTPSPVPLAETNNPTERLTGSPSPAPTPGPTAEPTETPTEIPTITPSAAPVVQATAVPETQPPTIASVTSTPTIAPVFRLTTTDEIRTAVDQYLEGVLTAPINEWDVSQISDFGYLFSAQRNPAAATFNEDLDNWDVSNAVSFTGLFRGAEAFNGDISTWDTSRVENFDGMFDGASNFDGDISNWDTGSANSLFNMFRNAESFDSPIGNWETGNVRNFSNIFQGASSFDQPLSWDTSNGVDFSRMFRDAANFNQDLSFETGGVTNMDAMFYDAKSFDGTLDFSDTSSVTSMRQMFDGADSFTGRGLESFDVSRVGNMRRMFAGASSLADVGEISQWDVGEVFNMDEMFSGASQFQENLCDWGSLISDSVTAEDMFAGTNCPVPSEPDLTTGTSFCTVCPKTARTNDNKNNNNNANNANINGPRRV